MPWFQEICRNLGLMVHNIKNPDGSVPAVQRQQVSRTVEEKQISPTMTLRRTTIEEVEVSHTPTEAPAPGTK